MEMNTGVTSSASLPLSASTALASFSSSVGQMSGQKVNPKYSIDQRPCRSLSEKARAAAAAPPAAAAPSSVCSVNGPPRSARPACGWPSWLTTAFAVAVDVFDRPFTFRSNSYR